MYKRKIASIILAVTLVATLAPGRSALAEENVIYAQAPEDIINALAAQIPDTRLVLSGKTYTFENTLQIRNMQGLTMIGTAGARIVSLNPDGPVLEIDTCDGVSINNIYFGHETPPGASCGEDASVISVHGSRGVIFDTCDLYGCGRYGFIINTGAVTLKNTVIRDCSEYIGTAYGANIEFYECVFSGNGYQNDAYGRNRDGENTQGFYLWDAENFEYVTSLTFNDCIFRNNRNTYFKREGASGFGPEGYNGGHYTRVNNCTFENNAWDKDQSAAPPADQPDSWAADAVYGALSGGYIPDSISGAGWRKPTTRIAAAESMVLLIEKTLNKSMDIIAAENGWDLFVTPFTDTGSRYITFLWNAGIVTGVGDNRYDPDGAFIRAHIVTLTGKIAEKFFGEEAQGACPFTDVPAYAAPYVGYAAEAFGIKGRGDGTFDPETAMQNQETAYLVYLAYNNWGIN